MSSKSPAEIAEAMCSAGYKKTNRPIDKMFILGILAGVYIGFGALWSGKTYFPFFRYHVSPRRLVVISKSGLPR